MKKKYFSPIYFAATWCQEKKKLKNNISIPSKKKIYHLNFFLAFTAKIKMNLVAPKNEITTVGKTLL